MNSIRYMIILLGSLVLSACTTDTYCLNANVLYFNQHDILTSESQEMIVQHNCTYIKLCDKENYEELCEVQD